MTTTIDDKIQPTKQEPNQQSLLAFTRKSVVGAGYRVSSSFAMDAVYLGLIAGNMAGFFEKLEPDKLARVAGFVVAINFVDYKWDVTNRLDKGAKKIQQWVGAYLTRFAHSRMYGN